LNMLRFTYFLVIRRNSHKWLFLYVISLFDTTLMLYLVHVSLLSLPYYSHIGMGNFYITTDFFNKRCWFSICGGEWHRQRISLQS
jgi:hypothetical protein